MKKIKNFLLSLQFIFKPSYWIANYRYNKTWDGILNRLMAQYNFIYIDEYTAKLGNYEIWIANHPEASMRPYRHGSKIRPSKLTVQRAYKKYINDIIYGDKND